jgi:RNA polymerase sigma-70 factor, ECF subfamily
MATAANDGPEAFRALYQANHLRVRGFLARMAGPQDADDLAQVVFAKAAKALPTFRGEAAASTWLYRIAVNVASDWLRSRSAQDARATVPFPDDLDEDMRAVMTAAVDSPPSPEQDLAEKDTQACIRGEIAKLSDGHRDIMMLSALGGLSDDEIAETLGISQGNAKVRLHRARQEFKSIIAARCDFYRNELSCKPSSADCCEPSDAPPAGKSGPGTA